jgi:hypothetical protein
MPPKKSGKSSETSAKEIKEKVDPAVTFATHLTTNFEGYLSKQITSIITSYIDRLVVNGYDKIKVLEIWNQVGTSYKIKLEMINKKQQITTIPGTTCEFYFTRNKENCKKEVSIKSATKKFCSRHISEETKAPKQPKVEENVAKCIHEFKSGVRMKKQCGAKVSTKSATGKYCSRHFLTNEKPKTEKKEETKEPEKVNFNEKLNAYVDTVNNWVIDKDDKKTVFAKVIDEKLTELDEDDIKKLNEQGIPCEKRNIEIEEEQEDENNEEGND